MIKEHFPSDKIHPFVVFLWTKYLHIEYVKCATENEWGNI